MHTIALKLQAYARSPILNMPAPASSAPPAYNTHSRTLALLGTTRAHATGHPEHARCPLPWLHACPPLLAYRAGIHSCSTPLHPHTPAEMEHVRIELTPINIKMFEGKQRFQEWEAMQAELYHCTQWIRRAVREVLKCGVENTPWKAGFEAELHHLSYVAGQYCVLSGRYLPPQAPFFNFLQAINTTINTVTTPEKIEDIVDIIPYGPELPDPLYHCADVNEWWKEDRQGDCPVLDKGRSLDDAITSWAFTVPVGPYTEHPNILFAGTPSVQGEFQPSNTDHLVSTTSHFVNTQVVALEQLITNKTYLHENVVKARRREAEVEANRVRDAMEMMGFPVIVRYGAV
ncbi:hypothetical protein OF83DRAFT_1175409 [Amylostereum chailletii]|nr:hypothetical protein OF83DRAFT_1175409 [Amylostereum chailletii]